jgi:IS5 family transposase
LKKSNKNLAEKAMKPKRINNDQNSLLESRLSELLNPRDALIILSKQIAWEFFEKEFGVNFAGYNGQPPKPIRLMVGLLMLQHMEGLSDEAVVERWSQNPYWQYFCGYDYLQWGLPIDGSSLVRFRKRIGSDGMDKILSSTIEAAKQVKMVKEKDLKRVIVDTTVMEKNITFPTDSKLLNKSRSNLVKLAKAEGVELRQSYERKGKHLEGQVGKYAHAKQYNRMNKALKKLKTILGRTVRDIERRIAGNENLGSKFQSQLKLARRLLVQEKTSKNKLYSLHEPHVYCITKGKAHKKYEFGCKVSLVLTHKQGLALSSQALPEAYFDGHTLGSSLENAEKLSNTMISRGIVDRGYKGHGVVDKEIYMSGQRRGITATLKKQIKRRSAIEPHIGHMKSDGKLDRNMLKGFIGDQINASLCAVGHNLRLIRNYIKELLLQFFYFLLFLHNSNKFT